MFAGPPPRKGTTPKGKTPLKAKSKVSGAGFGTKPLFCQPPSSDLVAVFRLDENGQTIDETRLRELGAAARHTIDENLPTTGAVLLRGLPMRSAEDFGHFWNGCLQESPAIQEGKYISLGPSAGRQKLSGIDLATNVPPQFLLLCHNELCYNPTTVGRIALYCVQDAKFGGETIIARNSDLNKGLPSDVAPFVKKHGGVLYSREFFDARRPPQLSSQNTGIGSWQAKCSLPDTASREEAEIFFLEMGFDLENQLEWNDETGVLRVTNVHPGFVQNEDSDEGVWWNIVHTGSLKTADGTPFPKKMVQDVQRTGWEHTFAFKLLPGDWLMIDNMRVQHGRLPYVDSPTEKRCLLTVYSHPQPSC